jgi:hypothetical protein
MKPLFFFFILAFVSSCQNEVKPLDNLIDVSKAEEAYLSDPSNEANAEEFADILKDAAYQNLKDSLAPYYLLKSALVYRSISGKELESIVKLQEVNKRFSGTNAGAEARFQEGFTWDEYIGNKEEAIKSYNQFIEEYPTHELRLTAEEMLMFLTDTIDPLERIELWKNQTNEDL